MIGIDRDIQAQGHEGVNRPQRGRPLSRGRRWHLGPPLMVHLPGGGRAPGHGVRRSRRKGSSALLAPLLPQRLIGSCCDLAFRFVQMRSRRPMTQGSGLERLAFGEGKFRNAKKNQVVFQRLSICIGGSTSSAQMEGKIDSSLDCLLCISQQSLVMERCWWTGEDI
jgi:hypothetical protein